MVVKIVNQKALIAINIIHAINDPGWANITVGITCKRQKYSNGNKIHKIIMDENNCWVKHHQGCWDIWYELSFGRASPILFGRRSKNPTSWASIFCSSAGEWEEEKSHFLKGLLCQKCLEYPAKLHLHTLLHIHALCTYYSTIVHCFGGFLKHVHVHNGDLSIWTFFEAEFPFL